MQALAILLCVLQTLTGNRLTETTLIDTTSRLAEVTYPNWQKTDYSYYNNVGDQRLKEIKNYIWGMFSNTPLSDFQYQYNPVGTISSWQQQTDASTPTQYALGYDPDDELTSAVQTNTSNNATVSSNGYNYDPAGNRLAETALSGTTAGQFNNLNQLTGYSSTTTNQTIAGTTSAAVSSVTVNAVAATITSGTNFSATVPLPQGTNIVSIVATPASGTIPITTQRDQIVTTGTAPTALTYDANGNTLTDEHGNSYTWDALNRLISITYPSGASSTFAYDGLSRRVQIIEKNNTGAVTSTKNYLWIGSEIVEERDSSNNVTKRFFTQGEQQSGAAYYYTRDHLGSVRELVDESGNIQARYSYDPYGHVTKVSGSLDSDFQYAGYYEHATSGLNLTLFRAYDPNMGRWLSRDPSQEEGGINLYGYVYNNPTGYLDVLGLGAAGYNGPFNGAQPPFAGKWIWIPNLTDTRGGTWQLSGQNITANWDPEGHWDVVTPTGKFGYDRYGNLIGDGSGMARHMPYPGPLRQPLSCKALAGRALQTLGRAGRAAGYLGALLDFWAAYNYLHSLTPEQINSVFQDVGQNDYY
jgi:RHS repeat-associated protein